MTRTAWAVAITLLLASCGGGERPATTTAAAPAPATTSTPSSSLVETEYIDCARDAAPAPTSVEEGLAELHARIERGDCGAITSLAVWYAGEMRFEAHYDGTGPDTRYPLFSVTKSVTSALVGTAVEQGLIALDDPVLGYFPRYDRIDHLDADKSAITIEDLLTMRAGLAWEEIAIRYGQPGNTATQMVASGDWVKFTLDRPMAAEPGTIFRYNTGASMLLSGIIQRAAGTPLDTYAAARLFAPLGIPVTHWRWDDRSAGRVSGGSGLHLTTRDMVNFGRLYLQQGEWEGEQVLPADWVAESTRPWVEEAGLVRSPGLPVMGSTVGYGFHWWRFGDSHPVVAGLDVNDVYFAWGLGGNFIFVVPHLDLVVATTAQNYDDRRCAVPAPACAETVFFAALRDYVLPAPS